MLSDGVERLAMASPSDLGSTADLVKANLEEGLAQYQERLRELLREDGRSR
jgi:hypothetical protein